MRVFYFLFFFTLFLIFNLSAYAIDEDKFLITINKAQFFFTENGKIKYSANAEIVNYDGENIVYQNGISAKEYDANLLEIISISSNNAKYLLQSDELILEKGVEIKQASTIIYCENLFFSLKEDFFYSNNYIKIRNNDNIVEGIGFEGKKDLSQFLIKKVNAVAKQKI